MEHLALEIFDLPTKDNPNPTGSKYVAGLENTTITITATSEIFAKGDIWSFSFKINIYANPHIFGTAGEIHGSRLHEQINKRRTRLWVEGLPLYLGYLMLDDEAEVDKEGNVDVRFEGGMKTFESMIEGARANQVPLMGDVRIGVALWRKRKVRFGMKFVASAVYGGLGISTGEGAVRYNNGDDTIYIEADGNNDQTPVQEYPRMVFPKGEFEPWGGDHSGSVNELNTDFPYDEDEDGTPTHPFCNVALCYQKTGYEKKNENGNTFIDYSSEPVVQRDYEVMPANRVNSAPNFFVIYWLRSLMQHLGIYVEENQMLQVEDLRRLFFVNTKCAYKEPKVFYESVFNKYRFRGNRLIPEQFSPVGKSEGSPSIPIYYGPQTIIKTDEDGIVVDRYTYSGELSIVGIAIRLKEVIPWTEAEKNRYISNNSYLHDAFADKECFPDVDISEVIDALESGFGVRFLFSDDNKKVRIVLLRNIFRNRDVQKISCEIIDEEKIENSTRGFRMTYGNKDDTHFFYKGFDDMLPHIKTLWPDESDKHDYSRWDLNATYKNVILKVSAFNKTCYVTPNNGNAFIVKIDKDAKRYNELHPSLFEAAGFMDAEDGDCTGEEETIHTITVGFSPAIMNDLNMEQERKGESEQHFALFVDEKMRPRRPDLQDGTNYNNADAFYDVDGKLYAKNSDGTDKYPGMRSEDGIVKPGEFAIASDMTVSATNMSANIKNILGFMSAEIRNIDFHGCINEGYRLYLQDNYEPNDDGVSPIETHDWGLTLGIMRGSGSDARVNYRPDINDNEGNDTWDLYPGSRSIAHPDTCDCYGNLWDYNGSQSGTGPLDGRFSLKLRAEKPNPYFDSSQPESGTNKRYLDITNPDLQKRGLCDQFYREYSYWLRNARIVKRTVRMELAQLLTIDKTKRVTVGDVTGFVRKMQYSVSNKTGLGNVTMEIMYI